MKKYIIIGSMLLGITSQAMADETVVCGGSGNIRDCTCPDGSVMSGYQASIGVGTYAIQQIYCHSLSEKNASDQKKS